MNPLLLITCCLCLISAFFPLQIQAQSLKKNQKTDSILNYKSRKSNIKNLNIPIFQKKTKKNSNTTLQ